MREDDERRDGALVVHQLRPGGELEAAGADGERGGAFLLTLGNFVRPLCEGSFPHEARATSRDAARSFQNPAQTCRPARAKFGGMWAQPMQALAESAQNQELEPRHIQFGRRRAKCGTKSARSSHLGTESFKLGTISTDLGRPKSAKVGPGSTKC